MRDLPEAACCNISRAWSNFRLKDWTFNYIRWESQIIGQLTRSCCPSWVTINPPPANRPRRSKCAFSRSAISYMSSPGNVDRRSGTVPTGRWDMMHYEHSLDSIVVRSIGISWGVIAKALKLVGTDSRNDRNEAFNAEKSSSKPDLSKDIKMLQSMSKRNVGHNVSHTKARLHAVPIWHVHMIVANSLS